ncbi:hypothetical protein GCM10025881_10450 [Pseudolysinimonas kribbensis]|uniref:Uncharacterized protein n=1 Tax=Pseudolysinimonas kribbensis TaxID=433641 RepID=A0ABQ6K607_9MICO|nr:hypothetical protein GCM10025881_10450 [Pseudolysinimonas kribbensis]
MSAYCAAIRFTGFSAFIADCMTTDMFCQRTGASCFSFMVTRFLPRKITSPDEIRAGELSSWAMPNSMVDLPHPDSPTTATNSPRPTVRSTSSTAVTGPAGVS